MNSFSIDNNYPANVNHLDIFILNLFEDPIQLISHSYKSQSISSIYSNTHIDSWSYNAFSKRD